MKEGSGYSVWALLSSIHFSYAHMCDQPCVRVDYATCVGAKSGLHKYNVMWRPFCGHGYYSEVAH